MSVYLGRGLTRELFRRRHLRGELPRRTPARSRADLSGTPSGSRRVQFLHVAMLRSRSVRVAWRATVRPSIRLTCVAQLDASRRSPTLAGRASYARARHVASGSRRSGPL